MRTRVLVVLAMALLSACAFAVDGVILINQATVIAAGGFPYKITQPGSYKLSGNLTMNTTAQGNLNGIDVAIAISSSNVSLDLNGFTITVNDLIGQTLGHAFYAIAETGALTQISIVNGLVRMTSIWNREIITAINFPDSLVMKFEELNLVALQPILDIAPPQARLLQAGGDSFVHHVVAAGAILLRCPSTAVDNIGFVSGTGTGCIIINNSPSLFVPTL